MVNFGNSKGNSSVIKFGSWDPDTLKDSTELKMLKTVKDSGWLLKASIYIVGG